MMYCQKNIKGWKNVLAVCCILSLTLAVHRMTETRQYRLCDYVSVQQYQDQGRPAKPVPKHAATLHRDTGAKVQHDGQMFGSKI
jgi:hypothetical protein